MDEEIFNRYCEGKSPFHEEVLRLGPDDYDRVPLDVLVEAVNRTMDFLQERNLIARIYSLCDWFEHDEYLSRKGEIPLSEVRARMVDEETLARQWPGDDFVAWGLYDSEARWYLRIRFGTETRLLHFDGKRQWAEEDVVAGSFDIASSSEVVVALKETLLPIIEERLVIEKATDYFRRISGR